MHRGVNIYFSLIIQCIPPGRMQVINLNCNNSPKLNLQPPNPIQLNLYMYMYFKNCHLILVTRCNATSGVTNCLNDCKDGMSLVLDMENQIIQKELISDDPNFPEILSL